MRLFPPPWEGRHAAFPSEEDASPAPCSHPSIAHAANVGLLGLLPLAIGGIFRLPRLRAFAFEATAYGAIIFSLYGISTSRRNENNILVFLDGQGIEVPSRKFIDRLGKVDKDDAVVWGAIGGLFAAHRFRTWSISGWKRYVGAAVFGAALVRAPIALVDVAAAQVQDSDHAKTLIKRELYKMGWEAAMTRTLFDQSEQDLRARGLDIPVVAPSDPATLLTEYGHDDGKKVLMAPVGERAIENNLMIGTKELHLPLMEGEALDQVMAKIPPPSSYVRYLMSPLGSDANALENNASTITQKRAEAAIEAEQAWHHMTKKEAEYLDATSSSEDEVNPALRRYLEVLGVIHWSLWSHASRRDWMITHLQQRKQQVKTHPQQSSHRDTTRAPSAKPGQHTASAKYLFTNMMLDRLSQRTEERKTNLQQSKRLLETVLSQLPIKPDRVHSSLGRPVPTRVGYQHAITKLEKEIDAVEFDTKVIKQLIDDVELGWK